LLGGLRLGGRLGGRTQQRREVLNAIIVDSSADLDEAILGVRSSAFSYGGQKCSACSRVIVLDDVHEQFVSRLVESARSLVVGPAADPATDYGLLIDDEAAAKVHQYIQVGRGEGRLLTPEAPVTSGRLIPPHIFDDVVPTARIAIEEIFGPVLSLIRAKSFEEAIAIANASPYKLTGGVYSRTPSHLQLAKREFRVGNLYLNRNITGALVGRQPFGGFGLSGLGTQAGGREYLLHFVHPRSVSENTMRRGFSPEQPRRD
jgi:RHH-type proline utilization regulon transcriptional repressor/proline dehydrogenase/delta 1-pyrroline-5-carboxylate dehydrogenase